MHPQVKERDVAFLVSDAGGEFTGGNRDTGHGRTGVYKALFPDAGWLWCMEHRLHLAFSDIGLNKWYDYLNSIAGFVRSTNNWSKLKPMMELLMEREERPDLQVSACTAIETCMGGFN